MFEQRWYSTVLCPYPVCGDTIFCLWPWFLVGFLHQSQLSFRISPRSTRGLLCTKSDCWSLQDSFHTGTTINIYFQWVQNVCKMSTRPILLFQSTGTFLGILRRPFLGAWLENVVEGLNIIHPWAKMVNERVNQGLVISLHGLGGYCLHDRSGKHSFVLNFYLVNFLTQSTSIGFCLS